MTQAVQDQARAKLGSLEAGRFVAALLVMLAHAVPYVNGHAAPGARQVFGNMTMPGPLCVQYFFVLSGFVMAQAHHNDFGKPLAPLSFWWRRAWRIYPVYWLALVVPAYYLAGGLTPASALRLLSLDPLGTQEFVPAAWTLRFEMTFYLMLSLCLLPYLGKPLLACWAAFTIWRWCVPAVVLFHPQALLWLSGFLQHHAAPFVSFMCFYFFAGLTGGYISARVPVSRRVSIAFMAVSLLTLIAMLPVEDWGTSYTASPMFMLAIAFAIAANVLGLALLERHGLLRLGRVAVFAGAMSYPLYMMHGPVLMLIDKNLTWGQHHVFGLYLAFFLTTAAIMAVTAAVTLCYDQPVQRYARKLAKKMKGEKVQPLALLGTEAPE